MSSLFFLFCVIFTVEKEKLVGKFTCSLCSHNLTTTAALKMHMWRHQPVSGDENYKCPDCAFITCCKSVYETHTRIHSRRKLYTCSVCGNGFNDLFTLRVHMRVHTGERPYTCKVCAKKFSKRISFEKSHMYPHRGVPIHLQIVWEDVFIFIIFDKSFLYPQKSETVCLQCVL